MLFIGRMYCRSEVDDAVYGVGSPGSFACLDDRDALLEMLED